MKCRLPENQLLLLHRRSLFVIEVITANHLSSLNFAAKKGKVRLSCNDSSTDQTVSFWFLLGFSFWTSVGSLHPRVVGSNPSVYMPPFHFFHESSTTAF